ncbi:ABC transporter substrate-binding protein [Gordonia jinhuaensis]|nr:ABC transporter substrate-binding protein [Gordonia jinhuaensis]
MTSKSRMTRLCAGIGTIATAVVVLSACGSSDSQSTAASGSAPAGLMKSGTLSVCTDPEYPPMEYLDNGNTAEPTGFDSDGARALGKLWGLDVKFVNVSFDGLIPALTAKRCDITWSALYISDERERVADGTAFMKTGPGLLVRTGDTSIKSTADLSGKTVAVQSGGANEQTLKDLSAKFTSEGKSGITIQAYPKTAETVAAVTNGKADALIETDVAIVDMVDKSNGKLVAVPGIFDAQLKFGVYTRKGSELTAATEKGITELVNNGTLRELATKYGLNPDSIVAP